MTPSKSRRERLLAVIGQKSASKQKATRRQMGPTMKSLDASKLLGAILEQFAFIGIDGINDTRLDSGEPSSIVEPMAR